MRDEERGLLLGLAGVVAFSLTLPATQVAVAHFSPTAVGLGRAAVAALPAAAWLAVGRRPVPRRAQWAGLAVVAGGAILGFPFLTAWAMSRLPSSHGAVILGLLPLATAGLAALRAGERPSLPFWLSSAAGAAVVTIFGLAGATGGLMLPDLALVGAVASAAAAYAEGGRLAREMEGLEVISWALVLSIPVTLGPALVSWLPWAGPAGPWLPWAGQLTAGIAGLWPARVGQAAWSAPLEAWGAFLYVSLVSQFLGFGLWYRGLALGGIARVGQLQLLQPFFTILASALLLGEEITAGTLVAAALVLVAVMVGRRSRPSAGEQRRGGTARSGPR